MRTTGTSATRASARAFALLGSTIASLGTGCASAPARPLRPTAAGAELAAVGYGTRPRRDLTTAVGSVHVRHDDAAMAWHVAQLLDGRVAGVQVDRLRGGDMAVRVRGATGDPLYVVDGIPFARGTSQRALLAMLNPADIARIDVLKDAGATSAYGSRGGNGVILITTRHSDRSGSASP